MENNLEYEGAEFQDIDPVGISVLLSIFSTTANVISFAIESNFPVIKDIDLGIQLFLLRDEVLKLQNSLDDFILLTHRYMHEKENRGLEHSRLTISETLFVLEGRNFQRWKSIQDSIHEINCRIYKVCNTIRVMRSKGMDADLPSLPFNSKLIKEFDNIILHMGELTFAEFIVKLRDLLDGTSHELGKSANSENQQKSGSHGDE